MPSPCAALTSAACLSSALTASRFPSMAASATGALAAACSIAVNAIAPSAENRIVRIIVFLGWSAPLRLAPSPQPLRLLRGHGRDSIQIELAGGIAEARHVETELVRDGEHRV